MFYHATDREDLTVLKPQMSGYGKELVFFSRKRENVLPYLCNAVRKYCCETGFAFTEPCAAWGTYGFADDGRLRMEEYYPDALRETYAGVSGWILEAENVEDSGTVLNIPDAVSSAREVTVTGREYIPDAYAAILQAEAEGKILIRRYEELSEEQRVRIHEMIRREYENASDHPEYRYFLEAKFPFVKEAAQLIRVQEMEAILNRSKDALERITDGLDAYEENLEGFVRLAEYYGSVLWMMDYEDDEAGKFPKDMPRGVLSEDAVFDLLADNKELAKRLAALIGKILDSGIFR